MAAAMSLVISVMGFAGGLTLSAIKRDRGVRDYGTLVEGHGGLLDRIDSLCFAAPVFFHFTLYWLKMQGVRQPWECLSGRALTNSRENRNSSRRFAQLTGSAAIFSNCLTAISL